MLQLWMQSEILDIVVRKCLINSNVVSSAVLLLEREEGGIHNMQDKCQACEGCIKMSQEVRHL